MRCCAASADFKLALYSPHFHCVSQAKKLKNSEAEVNALRGLTGEQRESISFLTQQLEDIKHKLDESTRQLEESRAKIHKMAVKFAS